MVKDVRHKKEILIIDDEKDIRDLLSGIIEDEGYVTRLAANSTQAIDELYKKKPDIVIVDIWLHNSEIDGLELLLEIKKMYNDLPIIVISGHGNVETAVVAIKRGAYDYLEKPFKVDKMLITISRAMEIAMLKNENVYLKSHQKSQPHQLVGTSVAITKIRSQINTFANSTARILIYGEKATHKTLVAKIIHQTSNFYDMPLEEIDFSQMNGNAIAEFIFGNEINGRINIGLFERVKAGTIILKSIETLPENIKKDFVSTLQKGYFYRVGGQHKIHCECRLITIVRTPIHTEKLNDIGLSQPLIDMLGVVKIAMPNLIKRREDIGDLVKLFIADYIQNDKKCPLLTQDAIDILKTRNWVNNIESLKNFIHKILIVYEGCKEISADMIVENQMSVQHEEGLVNTDTVLQYQLREAREIFEKQYIQDQMKRFSYNISQTSKFIGIDRSALHRKMKSLKIDVPF